MCTFTEEVQVNEIIECYEKNIINRRLRDFEEARADIMNKKEKEENKRKTKQL